MNRYYLMAILASLFWGFGFVGSSWAVETLSPAWANGLRFFLSAGLLLPFTFRGKRQAINLPEIKSAAIAAIFLSAVMILQTMSLKYTTVSKCGFITILYVLITPLISKFVYKEKLGFNFLIALVFGIFGVALLFELDIYNFNFGDLLALLSAMIFTVHLLIIDKVSKRKSVDLLRFNFFQVLFVGVLSLLIAISQDGMLDIEQLIFIANTKYLAMIGIVSTALFSTTLAFFFQLKAQQKIKPHIIGFIFLLESAFAALFGNLFLDEQLSQISILGCLILFGSVAYLPLRNKIHFEFAKIYKPAMMIFLFTILSSFN